MNVYHPVFAQPVYGCSCRLSNGGSFDVYFFVNINVNKLGRDMTLFKGSWGALSEGIFSYYSASYFYFFADTLSCLADIKRRPYYAYGR